MTNKEIIADSLSRTDKTYPSVDTALLEMMLDVQNQVNALAGNPLNLSSLDAGTF